MPKDMSQKAIQPDEQRVIEALRMASTQLLVRLSALEQSGQIGPEAAKAYAGWVHRVATAIVNPPKD